jgi:hypothetical protein
VFAHNRRDGIRHFGIAKYLDKALEQISGASLSVLRPCFTVFSFTAQCFLPGSSESAWNGRRIRLRIATARQVGDCCALWETAKVETMLGNAQGAGKRQSASRSPRKNRRRRNNASTGDEGAALTSNG